MKIIILESNGAEEIINHFFSYDLCEFILFENTSKKIDTEYYKINDIGITVLKGFACENTLDKLLKIKGSLEDSFFVVYAKSITDFDIDKIISMHKSNQKTATLVEHNESLCAMLLEDEVLDYAKGAKSLEKDVLLRIGEEQELTIYK